MNNKRLTIILFILTVVFTILGGTFAYWNWESNTSQKTNVTFTVNKNFTCGADSGGHITSNDIKLAPAKCTDNVYAIKRPITTHVTTTGDKVVSMDLWLNINSIDTNLTNTSNFKWVIGKNRNSCESGIINHGDFRNIQNNKINLLNDVEYATLNDTYYLYIWLDEEEANNNTQNQSFDFSIGGYCEDSGKEKALLKSLDSTAYFREEDYITKITDISFIYDEDLPSGIITNNVKTYDLGYSVSKPITGYLIENTDEGAAANRYKLYVSSQYKIYAQSLKNAFNGMAALKNLSFDNFDTSGTTSMGGSHSGMFYDCDGLTSLDLSSFNTAKVKDMSYMFYSCGGLTTLDLSYFNTSNVTTMHSMFMLSRGITSLNLSSFDTSNVSIMSDMFRRSSVVRLDLSNFYTPKLEQVQRLTYAATVQCNYLDIRNFTFSAISNASDMLDGVTSTGTIVVKDQATKTWIENRFGTTRNIIIADE